MYNYDSADNYRPVPSRNTFVSFARFLGITALICAFLSSFMGAFICGGMAIILAVLSRGSNQKMCGGARVGFVTGIVALVIQIFTLAVSIYSILYIPEFREQFNQLYEETYGIPIGDTLDELLEELGIPAENMDLPTVDTITPAEEGGFL